jgi:YfiH family protein
VGSALHLGDSHSQAAILPGGLAEVRFTGRRAGDMADPTGVDPVVAGRRRAVVDRPWTWLRQVHGARVVVVDAAGGGAGQTADAAVSASPTAALAVLTADCAPVVFASPEGVIGVAHAGWRGLLAGVVEQTVAAMRGLGASDVAAGLGPCIHPECYRFTAPALDDLVARFGPAVVGRHRRGGPGLDLPATVRCCLERAGAWLALDAYICTGCSAEHWSWRARSQPERQATVVWRP